MRWHSLVCDAGTRPSRPRVMVVQPPSSSDPEWTDPLPTAPPLPAQPPARPTSIRRGRLGAGIGIAVAGHVPASGLWLLSLYTFVRYATPDSPFAVDCLVILLQLALFAGCVVAGVRLIYRGDRSLGLGLLIGWAAGIVALIVGTILIAYSVSPDPRAAGLNTVHLHTLEGASTP